MTDPEQITISITFDVSRMHGTPITLLRGLLKTALRRFGAVCLRHELTRTKGDSRS